VVDPRVADVRPVELRIDEFSVLRQGEPLVGTAPTDATFQSVLLFAAESGTPPKIHRDKCTFESKHVESAKEQAYCKSLLRCGTTTLYGKRQTGFGLCEVEDGSIVRFVDEGQTREDGDPALSYVAARQAVTLRDSPGQEEYSLEFSVPPAESTD
jgi:hypothetical protein